MASGRERSLGYNPPPMSGDRMKLEVHERDELGSRHVRRLRKQGLVPGVLYGRGHSRAIAVPAHDLRDVLGGTSGVHAILDVVLAGQKTVHPSVLADYQQDPVRGTLTHVDLREVRLDQPINAVVAIHLIGESPGVKSGGALTLITREVHVEALPTDIPDHLEADIGNMEVGDVLRLEDVRAAEGVRFLDDLYETVVCTVSSPRGYAELEEAEAEAAAAAAAEAAEAGEGEPAEVDEAASAETGTEES
jgi:large subunit ribosomal protein L25